MAALTNLYVDAGTSYSVIINCVGSDGNPLNLAGYTVKSQIRKSYQSPTAYTFNPVVFSAVAGKIQLSLSSTESSAIKPGRYLYDVEITSAGGTRSRVAEGLVIVSPEITQI